MSGFHRRISLEDTSDYLVRARNANLLTDADNSVLVHDLSRLRQRIQTLQQLFPANTLHAVAIKANPVVSILRVAVENGAGLEAASFEEVHLALAAECPPDRIVFDSPAKTDGEINEALALGLILNANSFAELERIDRSLASTSSDAKIGLRINPEVGSGAISHTSVGRKGVKFGEPISQQARVLDAFQCYPWLTGLHTHVGSQGCSLELLVNAVSKGWELSQAIARETGRRIEFYDIGGGLPAVYATDQNAPDPTEYVQQLLGRTPELFDRGRIITEFGRAIHAGCGFAASRVEYVRDDNGLCIIHLGADLFLRPVYAAQDWRHEFLLLDEQGNQKRGDSHPIDIAGPLCFSGDIIGRAIDLPRVEVGDWLIIRDTGAYTLSMWSHHCNRGLPKVIGIDADTGSDRILRAADSPGDVVDFWS